MATRKADALLEEQIGWRDRKVEAGKIGAAVQYTDGITALDAVDRMWSVGDGCMSYDIEKGFGSPVSKAWQLVRKALGRPERSLTREEATKLFGPKFICDGCHRGLEEGWTYCPTCGRQIEPRAA